ncbi:predicted protein [Lichtheimia corymbifera JMRC:FSU:9682]|uniref:Secreted protein n=1 Tax=Lichtheimia corymbifera JMRC:FSU:9682 TaxID=1263082 RepID=A0A068RRE3_9FUNG|nr:predicted protein [Lichtheimia corymbifera JMRC:FSU:9682]
MKLPLSLLFWCALTLDGLLVEAAGTKLDPNVKPTLVPLADGDSLFKAMDLCKNDKQPYTLYVIKPYEYSPATTSVCVKGRITSSTKLPSGTCLKSYKPKLVKGFQHLWSYCADNGRLGIEVCDAGKHDNCQAVSWFSTNFKPGQGSGLATGSGI